MGFWLLVGPNVSFRNDKISCRCAGIHTAHRIDAELETDLMTILNGAATADLLHDVAMQIDMMFEPNPTYMVVEEGFVEPDMELPWGKDIDA